MSWILPVGDGTVLLDDDGSPLQFTHPANPTQAYLLDEHTEPWHTAEHRWGSGFLITDAGSGRWRSPLSVQRTARGVLTSHALLDSLTLTINREGGDRLRETYVWTNHSDQVLTIGSLGISVPIRDVYTSSQDALRRACHAHVWTGGAWAWLLAQPMSGAGPVLGVVLTTGELWAYSVESRNASTSSNVRGHLIAHVTDRARNSSAFGGQPDVPLEPGGSYELAWEVSFQPSIDAFLASTDPPAALDRLAAPVGTPIQVRSAGTVREVHGTEPGVRYIDVAPRSRTAVLFHRPVRELVERRIAFLLDHQRRSDRGAPDRFAFVPYDVASNLTQPTSGWKDWSDGAERIGMPALLQQARFRGWADADRLDDALRGWSTFARERLVTADGTVLWGSGMPVDKPRLYNFPWLAHFFADQYRLYGAAEDLDLAVRILERSYQLGATEHLSIGRAVPWMRAFGGPQPHVRLRDIGIRHWDGYWFGRNRQWGDTFPHYWSVLSAVACCHLGDHETADRIFRANLVDFADDGSATCAFVLPSCVDGVPGYRADPLANDQDWALTLWLRSDHPPD